LGEEHKPKEQIEKTVVTQTPLFNVNPQRGSITTAVKLIFKENPDRSYSPREIADEIDRLRQAGKVIVKAKTYMKSAYVVLRRLTDKKYIEKVFSDESLDPKYKKIPKSK